MVYILLFLDFTIIFSCGFLTRRPVGVNTNLQILYSQPADFIEDMHRFEFLSEDVANEMGKEPPAFVGGLFRQQEAPQPVDLQIPSQKQRADRSEGNGDGVRAFGTAGKCRSARRRRREPVGRLLFQRGSTDEAVIQTGSYPESFRRRISKKRRRASVAGPASMS